MKANLFSILFLFFLQFGFSQNYELIDKKVLNYPEFKNLNALSIRIKNDFDTDIKRVRAIYVWLANFVDYNLNAAYLPQKTTTYTFKNENEYVLQKRQHDLKKIEKAFKFKKAICIDYSLLFKEICTKLGVECQVIKGVTKVNPKEINTVRTIKDHAWNTVKIDNKWYLVDVTWSTGYEEETYKWVKSFNDFFFLTEPEYFLSSHYPEQRKWQLVEQPISLNTFFSKPVFYASYYKHGIKLANNQNGVLNVENNRVTINFNDLSSYRTSLNYMLLNDIYPRSLRTKKNKDDTYQATIKYKQNNNNVLTLYLDNQAILDFKIIPSR